jgi:thiol-disulfide isomerase/thioredoxin
VKPWAQWLLIGGLGLVGGLAGLGGAILVISPGSLLEVPGGQWMARQLLGGMGELPDGRRVLMAGDSVPTLALHDLQGQALDLRFGDRPVLINYWASWCPPCVEEMPLLDAFARSQGSTGVAVVGIALDEATPVRRFLDERPVSFPIHLEASGPNDSSMLLGNARGILPYSVLIDRQGRLQKTRLGAFAKGDIEAFASEP